MTTPMQNRCYEVLQEAIKAFPLHLRPAIVTNHVGNPSVEIGGSEVWCIPWCKDTDKMTPGNDFCIGMRRRGRAVDTVQGNVYGHHFDKAVEKVCRVMASALRARKRELAKLDKMADCLA